MRLKGEIVSILDNNCKCGQEEKHKDIALSILSAIKGRVPKRKEITASDSFCESERCKIALRNQGFNEARNQFLGRLE